MTVDQRPGFNLPRPPKDERVSQLYNKYKLGEAPSLAEIEVVATGLLSSPLTFIEGAELVLGRHVSGDLRESRHILTDLISGKDGSERFGLLLLQRAGEDQEVEKQK